MDINSVGDRRPQPVRWSFPRSQQPGREHHLVHDHGGPSQFENSANSKFRFERQPSREDRPRLVHAPRERQHLRLADNEHTQIGIGLSALSPMRRRLAVSLLLKRRICERKMNMKSERIERAQTKRAMGIFGPVIGMSAPTRKDVRQKESAAADDGLKDNARSMALSATSASLPRSPITLAPTASAVASSTSFAIAARECRRPAILSASLRPPCE